MSNVIGKVLALTKKKGWDIRLLFLLPFLTSLLEASLKDTVSTQSDAGSGVINVLSDVGGEVVFFTSDVTVRTGGVIPVVEIGDKEILGLFSCGVKLNPLSTQCVRV